MQNKKENCEYIDDTVRTCFFGAYLSWVVARFQSKENTSLRGKDRGIAEDLMSEWKKLSKEDKQPYMDKAMVKMSQGTNDLGEYARELFPYLGSHTPSNNRRRSVEIPINVQIPVSNIASSSGTIPQHKHSVTIDHQLPSFTNITKKKQVFRSNDNNNSNSGPSLDEIFSLIPQSFYSTCHAINMQETLQTLYTLNNDFIACDIDCPLCGQLLKHMCTNNTHEDQTR